MYEDDDEKQTVCCANSDKAFTERYSDSTNREAELAKLAEPLEKLCDKCNGLTDVHRTNGQKVTKEMTERLDELRAELDKIDLRSLEDEASLHVDFEDVSLKDAVAEVEVKTAKVNKDLVPGLGAEAISNNFFTPPDQMIRAQNRMPKKSDIEVIAEIPPGNRALRDLARDLESITEEAENVDPRGGSAKRKEKSKNPEKEEPAADSENGREDKQELEDEDEGKQSEENSLAAKVIRC